MHVCSLIKDNELLENYDEIMKKVKYILKKEFDSEPVYNEKYLKAKIKSYDGKINTNFQNNKILKEGTQCICLSVILNDSVFKAGSNYYIQVFLEDCKYVVKEKMMYKHIIDDVQISFDTDIENLVEKISNEEKSDKENSNEENSDK